MSWLKVHMIDEKFAVQPDGRVKASRKYYTQSDSVISGSDAMVASAGGSTVAAWGSQWDGTYTTVLANDVGTEFISPYERYVNVGYETPELAVFVPEEDLLARPAVIRVGYEQFMEEYTKDFDTTPKLVRNTAGEPFDRGPERLVGVKV